MEEGHRNKGTGGRPRKGNSIRKKRMISIRFSEPEYYVIKRRATHCGLTISAYCHSAILESEIKKSIRKEDMEVLRKLSGEANNLNQLARQANTYGIYHFENEVRQTLVVVQDIIEKLSDDWKNNKR